ncbi:helix-turn-helix domain-containing protein [Glycomyces arizonensis]|uniref:helix-turn-helix domain-containing protein n=1 Tax=Glycomyces arizonensis TaxID=256035 RepID=UPI0003F78CDB|nr:TetR/AcrR family transcriptional regulator [Glycomyces arizonensis]
MSSRSAVTKDAIAAAAAPVFGRYGYRKTTMDLIAQAAGVSRPAVYQYFDGKAAVYRAVAARVGDETVRAAEAAAAHGATTAERLRSALGVKLDFVAGTVEADYRNELALEAGSIAADVIAETEARYAAVVEAVLASADDLGPFDESMPTADAAALLIDAMIGIARSRATHDQMRERLRQLVDLAVRGLSAGR